MTDNFLEDLREPTNGHVRRSKNLYHVRDHLRHKRHWAIFATVTKGILNTRSHNQSYDQIYTHDLKCSQTNVKVISKICILKITNTLTYTYIYTYIPIHTYIYTAVPVCEIRKPDWFVNRTCVRFPKQSFANQYWLVYEAITK